MKRLLAISLFPIFCFAVAGQQNNISGWSLPYLGQNPPGMTPELFAPGIIATGYYERDIAISPDGTEIFYGLLTGRHVTILYTKQADGKWTEPDGKYLFFSARKTSERMMELSSKNTLGSLKEFLNSPQNGNYDIYWVSAGVIDALRSKKKSE